MPGLKKTFRKVRRTVKKRYGGKGGRSKLVKDVMWLKSVLNPEKKRAAIIGVNSSASYVQYPIGQVSGNSNGYYVADITPVISQGNQSNQRDGSSVKLHSTFFTFQISGQTAQNTGIRIKILIFQIPGEPWASGSLNTFVSEHLEPNQFVTAAGGGGANAGIIDYFSSTDPDHFNKARLVRYKVCNLRYDSISNQTAHTTCKFGIKYNRGKGHHLRWENNTDTLTQGQLLMVVLCDLGNSSSSTASTLVAVPVTAVSTGAAMAYSIKHFYYDN